MTAVGKIIWARKLFFAPYFALLLIVGAMTIAFDKGVGILYFQEHHNAFSDRCFLSASMLGEAKVFATVICILIFFRIGHGIFMGLSLAATGLIVGVVKHTVAADIVRPLVYFGPEHPIRTVLGSHVFAGKSFPSGHTAAAFCMFTVLCLLARKRWLDPVLLILATSAAVSRMYLGQHFLVDVFAGSLIGVSVAFLGYTILTRAPRLRGRAFLQRGLRDYLRRRSAPDSKEL